MISSDAYTEVYYIINEMSEELRNKIPKKIIQSIKDKMNKNYIFNIEDEDIEDVELLEDTEKVLSVLYTDYLATEEEKQVIIAKEKAIAREKNNYIISNNQSTIQIKELFPKKEKKIGNDISEETNLVQIDNIKWYKKIIIFLKKLFK